jgi:phenylacetate-CoA ligase
MAAIYFNPRIETASREELTQHQTARMQTLVREVLASNSFYGNKLREAGLTDSRDFKSAADIPQLPFTRKQELVDDQAAHLPFGTNLTYPLARYVHLNQTSGTTGKPLRWLDTRESWDWWARCWSAVYSSAGITEADRIFFAFSFGPFIGFWAAWAGAEKIGALAISGGAQDSSQRLRNLIDLGATALCCTPSYALHLAEIAAREKIDLRQAGVRRIVVAGEPGGSIPGTKMRIEEAWGAKLIDHTGATEVGAHGFTCVEECGVHLNEGEFLVEVINSRTGEPADEGELVLTNLDRLGSPIIRYRTGDQVRLNRMRCDCGRTFVRMEGGIIGRVDQMLIVRGVNIFPTAIEAIVRSYPEVQEFAVIIDRVAEMDEMEIQIEVAGANPQAVADAIMRDVSYRVGLRVNVSLAAPETLPRFELKARRITDKRKQNG